MGGEVYSDGIERICIAFSIVFFNLKTFFTVMEFYVGFFDCLCIRRYSFKARYGSLVSSSKKISPPPP